MTRTIGLILSLVFLLCIGGVCQQTDDSLKVKPNLRVSQDSAKEVPDFLKKIINKLESSENRVSEEPQIEIDGLIVDETRTKAGHDFYDRFFARWNAPGEARDYSIKVRELPFRMSLTIILIEVNDNQVFKSYLQPRQNLIEETADQAIQVTTNYLKNYENIQKQLGSQDQKGNGIY